jgi:hypothetical protein
MPTRYNLRKVNLSFPACGIESEFWKSQMTRQPYPLLATILSGAGAASVIVFFCKKNPCLFDCGLFHVL